MNNPPIVSRTFILATLLVLHFGELATAQAPVTPAKTVDKAATTDAAEAKKAHRKKLMAFAKSFTVYGAEDQKNEATLLERPIFTWANPQRQAIGGSLYMWTLDGRPHATMGVWNFTNEDDTLRYELQSLSPDTFDATHPVESDWLPRSAGLDFVEIKDAKPPADSALRRKLQMKRLATQDFSATMYNNDGSTDQLRLLPEPIYRYPDARPENVMDGAMFSFAQGTDPEVFLIIEARKNGDKRSWFYAMAPSTVQKVIGRYKDNDAMTNGVDVNGADRLNTFTFRAQQTADAPLGIILE